MNIFEDMHVEGVHQLMRENAELKDLLRALRALAKNAKVASASPDYDEEYIRESLWLLVDAVLTTEPATAGDSQKDKSHDHSP